MNDETSLRVDRSAKTLRELALEKMRAAILDFHFHPGERLVERALCERLGVSRTVVREVLRHLEAEGLVESLPHQGPAVSRPDPAKAGQVYELRAVLEALAAQTCAQQAQEVDIANLRKILRRIEQAYRQHDPNLVLRTTTEFYEVMFRSAGKSVAWEVVQSLNARINHLRAMTISTPGRSKTGVAEMRRIVDAIAARAADEAYAASVAHVQSAARLALDWLSAGQQPDQGALGVEHSVESRFDRRKPA